MLVIFVLAEVNFLATFESGKSALNNWEVQSFELNDCV